MVVAVWAILVTFVKFLHVFSEAFLALFAGKGHLECLLQGMRLCFPMALCAVEPFPAAWTTNCYLSIENVFADLSLAEGQYEGTT